MKITYPHMGHLSAPISNMLRQLDIEVCPPPPITKKTVELGSLHSPEGVCLPYKINMGNFLESLDQGADAVITLCGAGKCRFGFYGALQKSALQRRKAVSFFTVDTEHLLGDLYRLLTKLSPRAGRLAILRAIALTVQKLRALDEISAAKNRFGARCIAPDKIIAFCEYGCGEIAECDTFGEISHIRDLILDIVSSQCDPEPTPVPRVALVGEFYVLLEPYVNHWIENHLITQGIHVQKFVNYGNWAYSKVFLQLLGLYNEETDYLAAARPYMTHHVGGDGLKSVGAAAISAAAGYDGIIHVYPFGCMPEIVAQYALKNLSADHSLPLLTLGVDEHSSAVGITTRLEAFADCIKRQKPNPRH